MRTDNCNAAIHNDPNAVCCIIGASHGGVNFAFQLRKNGWAGHIIIFDVDPVLPYHRPPLSKAYLTSDDAIESNALKSADAYEQANITLRLGVEVRQINRESKQITLISGETQDYSKLVLATGARPFIPPIKGISAAKNLFPLRTALDVSQIKAALNGSQTKRVVIIGGGYIGLETAASMKKMGANITVLERESRLLARITGPVMSDYFLQLHRDNGVDILTEKNVTDIVQTKDCNEVVCADGTRIAADIIVVGVGIRVNQELAAAAGIDAENGIKVDTSTCTSDSDIYAIGDCTWHFNTHYQRYMRLESVQNAVDQAKVAASVICGKSAEYNSVPWFWSDQYDVKLQMVGLSQDYTSIVMRLEEDDSKKFSVWYFKNDKLIAVDAVNNAKAYVIGTKVIKSGEVIDQTKLANASVELKPVNILVS